MNFFKKIAKLLGFQPNEATEKKIETPVEQEVSLTESVIVEKANDEPHQIDVEKEEKPSVQKKYRKYRPKKSKSVSPPVSEGVEKPKRTSKKKPNL